MQRSTVFFFFLSLFVGFVLFKVKYEVVAVEQQLELILQQTKREKDTIHILKAEWSHLNEPQRLQKLAEKFLDIQAMKAEQIVAIRSDVGEKDNFKDFFPQAYLASVKGEE